MPHDSSGHIYRSGAYGVEIADIQAVVPGASSYNDIGNIIANASINMWAKYKPVRQNTYMLTGETAGNSYWQASDLKCGLSIPEYSGFDSTFMSALLGGNALWGYERPNSKYLILDFDGYDDNAPSPMEQSLMTNVQVLYDGTLQVDYDEIQIQGNDSIKFSDIIIHGSSLSNWYFGVFIYSNSTKYEFYSSQTAIGSSASNLSVIFSGMNGYIGDTVQIVPFLSSSPISTQSIAPSSGYFISFNLASISVSVAAASSGIEVYFDQVEWNSTGTGVDYSVRIVNTNSSSRTIGNIVLCLYDGDPSSSGQLIDTTTTSVTISGNDSYTITNSFSSVFDQSKMYYFTIISQGSTLIPYQETQVEEYNPPVPL